MSVSGMLLALARRVMPASRREWMDAMRFEAGHVSKEERLRWAFGCLLTSLQQRFVPMNTGDLRVSRWVMFVEAAGGFGPLSVGWYLATFVAPGFIRWKGAALENFVSSNQGGEYILAMAAVFGIVGLLGPIGLFLGLRYAFTGRALENRFLGWVLVVIPVAAYLFGIVAGFMAGPPDFEYSMNSFLIFIAFTAVPAGVVYHLMSLARPARPVAPVAVAA